MPYLIRLFTTVGKCLPFLLLFSPAQAQTANTGSPYSRFGLGDLQAFNLVHNRGMGGLSVAISDPLALQLANPAGLSGLKLTTFEFAASGRFLNLQSSTQQQNQSNFNINYFTFGFPVSSKWGTAIGFLPYSTTNYNIQTRGDSSFASWNEFYEGLGGINRVFWSNGFKINDQWHVGVTTNFLFGTMNQTRRFEYSDTLNTFNLRVQDEVRVTDASMHFGVQYRTKLANKHQLNLGMVFELPSALNASRSFTADRYTYQGSTIRVRDTVSNVVAAEGSINLPWALSLGASYAIDGRWLFGAEIRLQDWSKYRFLDGNDSLQNSMSIAGGVQYRPDVNALGKSGYLKTVQYRAGFRYHNTYLQLRDQAINEVGITLGATFPVRRSNSAISFAFESGLRGTTTNGLIREQYNNVTISFTLNDRWFMKRKYD
jgi:long-subunit fatty acid transport protein